MTFLLNQRQSRGPLANLEPDDVVTSVPSCVYDVLKKTRDGGWRWCCVLMCGIICVSVRQVGKRQRGGKDKGWRTGQGGKEQTNEAQAASSKQQAHRKSQDTHLLAGGRSSRQPHAGALSPWLPLGYHWGDVCEASALWKANAPCLIWSSTQVKNSCSKSSSKAPASRSD